MLKATDARKLVEESDVHVEALLREIEPKIRDVAMAGKQELFWHLESVPIYRYTLDTTPTRNGAIQKLKEHGYTVSTGKSCELYVPRGLADDDGDGPIYQSYGIFIKW